MRKSGGNCKKDSKVILRGIKIFIAVIAVVLCVPQIPFAASQPKQTTVNKTLTDIQGENESKKSNEVTKQDNTANSDKQVTQTKEEEKGSVGKNSESKDKEDTQYKGVDLSNDPDYRAQLKKIYSEEDLKRLDAPRKWVTMPNVEGMTEADAIRTMKSLGIVVRVAYEDYSAVHVNFPYEDGTCVKQDITAGQQWNTDASVFIYIQRKDNKLEKLPVKEEVKTTPKSAETSKHTESTGAANEAVQLTKSSN
ncbi:PASTA domain-containing protein [Clostridium magnum]|uniref:PASTA domain protein n=1 Tax=Clostridium magnum DSM 2767 TaxID=1121326 RepID=A0A161W167_9CLOT|nr:PASTA domain-containing protein [Clostridium magnum]KZL88890.1 PASTA domain protein [Clostridium magnum DSM 2767]SHI51796.1 PASTA domain-containing protein [Clostridium magnum DSM 2767]